MRYLNQKTAHVMQTLNDTKQPAAITRRGQFVALIIPLANADVESALLSAVLEQTENVGQLIGTTRVANISSPEDADQKLSRKGADDD